MKSIVIYYSYSGHTKMIAEKIKNNLNCDIKEIIPIKPYSSDYQLVVKETEDNQVSKSTPDINDLNVNFSDYDQVIIGTPVWWYTMTPPVRTLLTKTDLSGKTVIPFATNAGWLGSTIDDMEIICNGNIKYPKSIRFSTDYAEDKLVTPINEIDSWINDIRENS